MPKLLGFMYSANTLLLTDNNRVIFTKKHFSIIKSTIIHEDYILCAMFIMDPGGYLGKNGCWVCADLKGRFFHL